MPSVHDVASYILKKLGPVTAMKLEKLVYYCQAWSLVWDDKPLFPQNIQAWANGPVVRDLYDKHKGRYMVNSWKGNPDVFKPEERETIDRVLEFYGTKTSQWLSDLTHRESPWLEARQGLAPSERGNNVISHASMAEYYSSL